ncbi:HNH endonuclease [Chamaesiphon minutus]|uniref:Putative restriction endonuclease n=1 Tax=Chamaesiphon minutus (strain ATCC 27169 / PCC 6605) TaxID=1173020 RepID=K9UCW6_CHAP6|nr:HNH endonuclease [Chamaesiphon minutus]AFY92947.1 putative restriction endonuclease [Chamaesiphon minutus PCC 6605]
MVLTSDYPDNWAQIATAIKQAAGYRCDRCGLKCLPPARSYRHLDRSLRRRLSAQVHHVDRNPAHNDRANLVCVCAGCHLRLHRHHPKPTPGQLALKLKLPKVRRSRQKDRNFQLTLADLIDRLPQLPSGLSRQLELDLDDRFLGDVLASDVSGALEYSDLQGDPGAPIATD